jgi:hypothetical protein
MSMNQMVQAEMHAMLELLGTCWEMNEAQDYDVLLTIL